MGNELLSKHTQQMSREERIRLLAACRGDEKADLRIDNVQVLDIINGGYRPGPILISGKNIAGIGPDFADHAAHQVWDAKGAVAVPGFIDSHLHIESSLMTPLEFERATLPLGTTTVVCDPHEIVNVMGQAGIQWFLRCSEKAHQNQFIQVSSCVPALPGKDVNGSDFPLAQMQETLQHPHVIGLAEMMNVPGVIHGDPDVMDKLEAFEGFNLDGHCPLLRGQNLNAYIAAGIQNCHETVSLEEGKEKLALGMAVMIREGSVAKNLHALAPLITEFSSPLCLLCTDDRNPWEIEREGHIDFMIRTLIQTYGCPVHVAYRVASWSAAQHFHLRRLGLIAPGYKADIVLLSNPENVDIQRVLIGGQWVDTLGAENAETVLAATKPPMQNSVACARLSQNALQLSLTQGKTYRAARIVPNELITTEEHVKWDGHQFDFPDTCHLAVIERYGKGLAPTLGLVQGFNLQEGALAGSVSHDSHNLIVIGKNSSDMTAAANRLLELGGGFVVVKDGKVLAELPLPIAGLMSPKPAAEISLRIEQLKQHCRQLGVKVGEPFIQMAFLALPVIPALKQTTLGLFDVNKFEFVPLEVS